MLEKIFSELEETMNKTIQTINKNFATIRTGRASSGILDRIEIDYYGTPTSIKHVGNITTPDSRTIMIVPFEKNLMGAIERAIQKSDLNVNPQNDGQAIRIIMPQLTEERRKELVKSVKKMSEDGKVAIRNERRNAVEKIKKLEKDNKNKITEDESKKAQEKAQKLTDKFIADIDKLAEKKEKEVMEI
jgi:ribosome recycling factor